MNLLEQIQINHPAGLVEGKNKSLVIIIDLGTKESFDIILQNCLSKKSLAQAIDLTGISVITPSVARTLLQSSFDFIKRHESAVVLVRVEKDAADCIESELYNLDPPRAIWILNKENKTTLAGRLSEKPRMLLSVLADGPASASQIAFKIEGNTAKKTVGNISVYLQSLFKEGLICRTKVTALDRDDASRGWTYQYFLPYLQEDKLK